ncbi:MAG: cupin domain-containing protein [Methanobacteriota archaeon]
MVPKDISGVFEHAPIIFPDSATDTESKPWYSPPGCYWFLLKDFMSEKETAGNLSYHMVMSQEQCEVPHHDHDVQWEWNVILKGNGSFRLGTKNIKITAGQTFATPPGVSHTVQAGSQELVLLAMFVPALV